MKRMISVFLSVAFMFVFATSAFCEDQWTGTLDLQVINSSSSADGKAGVYTSGGTMYRSFNYENFPNGYAQVIGYGTNSPHYNLRGGLRVRSGGSWVAAGSEKWFSCAIGTSVTLPIYSQYRDDPDISFQFRVRANTNESVGTYNVIFFTSAVWDLGR